MSRTEDLLPDISAFCRQHALLPQGGRIIVGLSGGPDSLALLDLLQRMADRCHLTICAAHLNHGLRAEAADQDEQAVRDYCALNGIELRVRKVGIADLARASGLTVEEAGRNARYEFFHSIALESSVSEAEQEDKIQRSVRIAVGHHRDDQAETVLMNLCRGSGLQGLAGMMPQNGLIIRPLLDISREQIDRYNQMRGLTPCLDQTNTEPEATRNRMRLSVLPAIQAAFGSDASPAIARAATLLRTDSDYLECAASAQLDRLLAFHTAGEPVNRPSGEPLCQPINQPVSLPVGQLSMIHPAIRTRILRQWFKHVFGDVKDLSEKHIMAMDALCRPNVSGHACSLPGGRRAIRDFDRLLLESPQARQSVLNVASQASLAKSPLMIPGLTEIPGGGGFFVTQFIENAQQIVYNSQIWCFPAADMTGAVVRRRQPQDHIRPEGRTCGKTLKKYLTEQKIPASVRNSLPLVARGSEILWIPGVTAARQLHRPDSTHMPGDRWVVIRYQATEG